MGQYPPYNSQAGGAKDMEEPSVDRPTVYMETSVVSYLTAWPSRDVLVLANQELTRLWWEERRRYRLLISPFVIQEARGGDPVAAAERLAVLTGLESLDPTAVLESLAQQVQEVLRLPARARFDALHIACAMHYEVDYLVSWNCAHLANAERSNEIAAALDAAGYGAPVICTPELLMGE